MAGPARGSSLGSASNSSGPGSRSANSPAVAALFSGPIEEAPPAVWEALPLAALPAPPWPPMIFTATNKPMATTAKTTRTMSAVRLSRRRFAGRAMPLIFSSRSRLGQSPIIPCPARRPFDFPVFLPHNRRKGPRKGKGFGSGTTKTVAARPPRVFPPKEAYHGSDPEGHRHGRARPDPVRRIGRRTRRRGPNEPGRPDPGRGHGRSQAASGLRDDQGRQAGHRPHGGRFRRHRQRAEGHRHPVREPHHRRRPDRP